MLSETTERQEYTQYDLPCMKMLGNSMSNITVLSIICQDIPEIKNLEQMVNLEKLWICETRICVIQGLECCTKLKELYLYNNSIQNIQGLDSLKQLKVLWLNDNQISTIENLESLECLTEFVIANNSISKVQNSSFSGNPLLEILNLSGNPLETFDSIDSLSLKTSLKQLFLQDETFGECPVVFLKNYHVWMFTRFTLSRLDSIEITSEILEKALNYYNEKSSFYSMKCINTSNRAVLIGEMAQDYEKMLLEAYRFEFLLFGNAKLQIQVNENSAEIKFSFESAVFDNSNLFGTVVQDSKAVKKVEFTSEQQKQIFTSLVENNDFKVAKTLKIPLEIHSLSELAFTNNYSLTKLVLSNNGLNELSDLSLKMFPNLKSLDLSNNKFRKVPELIDLTSLECLNLSGNRILALFKTQIAQDTIETVHQELPIALKELSIDLKCQSTLYFTKYPHLEIFNGNQMNRTSLTRKVLVRSGITVEMNQKLDLTDENSRLEASLLENDQMTTTNGKDMIDQLSIGNCLVYYLPNISEIYISDSMLQFNGLFQLENLKRLSLVRCNIESISLVKNHTLKHVNLSGNLLKSIRFALDLPNLESLYISDNLIKHYSLLRPLAYLKKARVFDFAGNPCDSNDALLYSVFMNPSLKYLNGNAVTDLFKQKAQSMFRGRLFLSDLMDQLSISSLNELEQLDLSNQKLNRLECFLEAKLLNNLKKIDLSNNELSNVSDLLNCRHLQHLDLSSNRIEGLFKAKSFLFSELQFLNLSNNQISSIESIQLENFPKLRQLFLNGNRIQSVPLIRNSNLTVLQLNSNEIREFQQNCFSQLALLRELSVSDNKIKTLFTEKLENLEHLNCSNNRLNDLDEFDRVAAPKLRFLNIQGNPINRIRHFRYKLAFIYPQLQSIDSTAVTEHEKERATVLFTQDPQEQLYYTLNIRNNASINIASINFE